MTTEKLVNEWSIDAMSQLPKNVVLNMIRKRLAFPKQFISQIQTVNMQDWKIYHRRFDFSGYENNTGEVTVHNMSIVNEFADLGIYDYTQYLFVDFAKGDGTIFLKYYWSQEQLEVNVAGFTTSEIIYEIFELTIFSGQKKRRRI